MFTPEQVQQAVRDAAAAAARPIRPAYIQAVALAALEELERRGEDANLLGRLADKWLDAERSGRFADLLTHGVRRWLEREPTPGEWMDIASAAVRLQLDVPATGGSHVRTRKLARIAEDALVAGFDARLQDSSAAARDYAEYLRLVRDTGESTAAGSISLALTGRDLVKWLLSLEVNLGVGRTDSRHLSGSNIAALLRRSTGPRQVVDPDAADATPWAAIARLEAFGLLQLWQRDGNPPTWELYDEGRALLTELLDPESPMRSLARATLADDLSATIAGVTGQAIISDYARREVTQHAREVSHEIRNALSPAALAIAKIRSHLEGTNDGATLDVYVRKIEQAINRSLDFADSSTLLAHLSGTRVEEFRCHDAVLSAIAAIDSGARIHLPGREVVIRGDRQRFELALVNILRNAEQARRESAVRVQIEIRAVDTVAELTIDDDGPGVPERERARIFDNGIHLNPDGTGHGLAIARQVIEREFRGVINCSDGALGGARFTLRIPRVGG